MADACPLPAKTYRHGTLLNILPDNHRNILKNLSQPMHTLLEGHISGRKNENLNRCVTNILQYMADKET